MLVWWTLGLVAMYWSQAAGVDGLYRTQDELDQAAATMADNAALIAMAGPARALNTTGGQVAWQCVAFGAILTGLMSMFLVGRHTRAEEESGRDELIRAAAVGRQAPLLATAVVAVVANVVVAAAIAASLIAYGLDVEGSLAIGAAAGLAGLVFGAVALVAVQLVSGTRAAYAITGAVIAASYLLRAVGDVADNGLSWASPIAWGQQMRSYAGQPPGTGAVWWPVLLSLAAASALTAVAAGFFRRRDIGSGVWPANPGPAVASDALGTVNGLAWRLQRWSVIGWAFGMLAGGFAYGTIGDQVGDLVGESDLADEMFGLDRRDLVDSFYATSAAMLAVIACGFAVSSVGRLRSEEAETRAEVVLATATSRTQWAWSHLQVAAVGSVAAVLLAGVGMGLGYTTVTGDGSAVARLAVATVPHSVSVLVVAAVAWLGYGLRRGLVALGWFALAWSAVVLVFGATLRFPEWLQRTSPFSWLAKSPAEPFAPLPLAGLAAVVVLLGFAGFALLRRRDVTA
jgi:ABC-2 type transport system permease protein